MKGYRVIRAIGRNFARLWGDQSGAAGLILAAAIMTIGFTALAIFLKGNQSRNALERAKADAIAQAKITTAILAYYQNGDTSIHPNTVTLPCPDRKATPNGDADTTCNLGSGTPQPNPTGVVPWKTLGLSKQDVVDTYGNYFTYVVSNDVVYDAADTSKDMCENAIDSYDATRYYTGKPNVSLTPSLTISPSTDTTATTAVPFAIIAHGANRLGALTSAGVHSPAPSGTSEIANCHPNTTGSCTTNGLSNLITGPRVVSPPTAVFDDQIVVPTATKVEDTCLAIGKGNTDFEDTFENGTGIDGTKWDTGSGVTSGVTRASEVANGVTTNNHVARFGAVGARLVTNTTNYNLDPTIQPRYVSMIWTPDAEDSANAHSTAGISIATRATFNDLDIITPTDLFSSGSAHGITFRFFDDANPNRIDTAAGANGINTISIYDGTTTAVASSGSDTYKLIHGKHYLLEVYDDGNNVWARATQTDDLTNTATVGPFALGNNDLNGENRILIVNDTDTTSGHNTISYIDDVIVGTSMQALALDGSTTTPAYASHANLSISQTNGFTIETWVRTRVLPTTGTATLLAEFDPTDTTTAATANAFRIYVDTSGQLHLSIKGANATVQLAAENYAFNYYLTPYDVFYPKRTWHHIAVTFSTPAANSRTLSRVRLFVDGRFYAQSDSSIIDGVNPGSREFRVGADTEGNYFRGDFSDVRVWNVERTPAQILQNYYSRLAYIDPGDTSLNNLVLNWKFDPLKETSVIATAPTSTFPDATYGAIQTPEDIADAGSALNAAPDGTITSGTYISALANFFRPGAREVCPTISTLGTITGAYQCDFRTVTRSTTNLAPYAVPNTVPQIFVQVWGAGGGSYFGGTGQQAGGGGGYSAAQVPKINSTPITGENLDVFIGGGGTANTASNEGGGGGAGTALRLNAGAHAGLVAGGGGGGSYSNIVTSTGYDCSVSNTLCGQGGGGGGAGATLTRAFDGTSTNACGGRGGDTSQANFLASGPPAATDCPQGGDDPDPSGTPPTAGAGGNVGNGGVSPAASSGWPSTIGWPGGDGYQASANAIGAGGGGGGGNGVFGSTGGEGGGYKTGGSRSEGYGGGGGAGYADSTGGVTVYHGAATTYTENNLAAGRTGPYYSRFSPGVGGASTAQNAGSAGGLILTW